MSTVTRLVGSHRLNASWKEMPSDNKTTLSNFKSGALVCKVLGTETTPIGASSLVTAFFGSAGETSGDANCSMSNSAGS